MHGGTVVYKDAEVGMKRKHKHKPELCLFESTENPEVKKRRPDGEVLEVSALLNNEVRSVMVALQHHREQ